MAGRHPSPSAAVTRGAQSVPTGRQGGPARGYDGGKQVKGRKCHGVARAMGLVLAVVVSSANESEGQKAPDVSQKLLRKVPRFEVVFADNGYEGTPNGLVERCFGWLINIVRREEDDSTSGFEPPPKRWVVEQAFGWFASWRRLGRPGYEYRPESSEAMIQIGMSRLMVSRLKIASQNSLARHQDCRRPSLVPLACAPHDDPTAAPDPRRGSRARR